MTMFQIRFVGLLALISFFVGVTDSKRYDVSVESLDSFGKEINERPLIIPYQEIYNNYESSNIGLSDSVQRTERKRRGVIWNKLKKIKKSIVSAKKKILKIKQKAIEIVKGPDHGTPKPTYESTGGSWGWFEKQKPKNNMEYKAYGSVPLLSSSYGPPYSHGVASSSSKGYGVSVPISSGQSAASWSYGPSKGGSRYTRMSNYRLPNKNQGSTYGYSNNNEPNYKGLAVRSRL